jgi:hypothetical protein
VFTCDIPRRLPVEVVREACRGVVRKYNRERESKRTHKVARTTPEREIEGCRETEVQSELCVCVCVCVFVCVCVCACACLCV